MGSSRRIEVVSEVGAKRTFVSAIDWPGWCRSGKDLDAALAALMIAAPLYAGAISSTGLTVPTTPTFEVVETLAGSATTDFGAPGAVASADRRPVTVAEARRLCAIVAASWEALDGVVARAPAELTKGPRGGGRDRDAVAAHVGAADHEYAKKLGVRMKDATELDRRRAVLAVLALPSDGGPVTERGWPARYAARRIAWHALDHAWEIEDRSPA